MNRFVVLFISTVHAYVHLDDRMALFITSKLPFECIFVFKNQMILITGGSCLCSGPSIAILGSFVKHVGIQNIQNQ